MGGRDPPARRNATILPTSGSAPMLRRHRREPVAKLAAAEEQRAVALPQPVQIGAPHGRGA